MRVLADICEFIVDCEHKTAPVQDEGYPSIRTPNIGPGYLILDGVNRVSQATYDAWTRRAEPQGGDLILAREAPVGNVAVIPDGLKCCLGQRTVLMRPKPSDVDSDYLCYLLLTPAVQADLLGKSGGATVHHLNLKDIRALLIPELPSLSQQRKLAGHIKAYDDLIENNRRRIALLEESARLLYREWFVDLRFPGHEVCATTSGIPVGWSRRALGAAGIQMKELADPKQLSADTAYLSMEHMNSKSLTLGVWESASKVSSTKLRFESDDVLFGRIRPYFHKVGIAQTSGVTSTDVIVVRAISEEFLPLVALVMSSDEFVAHAVTTSNGTKMPRADWKVLKDWPVLVPDTDLLAAFAGKVLPMFRLCKAMSSQNRYLQEARNALLPKLMSGEIAV